MRANVAACFSDLHALLPGALDHQPVMFELIGMTLIVFPEAAHPCLMLDAFLWRHELPAARIVFAGAPRTEGKYRRTGREQRRAGYTNYAQQYAPHGRKLPGALDARLRTVAHTQ